MGQADCSFPRSLYSCITVTALSELGLSAFIWWLVWMWEVWLCKYSLLILLVRVQILSITQLPHSRLFRSDSHLVFLQMLCLGQGMQKPWAPSSARTLGSESIVKCQLGDCWEDLGILPQIHFFPCRNGFPFSRLKWAKGLWPVFTSRQARSRELWQESKQCLCPHTKDSRTPELCLAVPWDRSWYLVISDYRFLVLLVNLQYCSQSVSKWNWEVILPTG